MRRFAISLAALLTCSGFFTPAAADPITLKFSQFLGPTRTYLKIASHRGRAISVG